MPLSGGLPASTPASSAGTAAPGTKLEPVSANLVHGRMLSVYSSSSLSPSIASSSQPPSVVVTTTLGPGEDGGGGGGGGGRGELVTLRSSRGVSTFATPENYGEFPQPFSGLDVRVVPYERKNSRSSNGGGGRRGSFVAGEGGGDGEGSGSVDEEDWPQPEADVADLVMDNNEFYTPHGDGGGGFGRGDADGGGSGGGDDKALREAVVMVAAAAAETKAHRRKSSYAASNGASGCLHSFDTEAGAGDTVSGSGWISLDTDSDAPSAGEDRRLAAAAVAAAAAAASKAPPSAESEHNGWDTSFSTEAAANGAWGGRRPSGASVFSGNGSERSGGGGGGGGAPVPPTPRSLPGLVSMSFSASVIEEGFGQQQQQQQLSPNAAFLRSQEREGGKDHGSSSGNVEGDVEDPVPASTRPPVTGGGAAYQQQQQLQKRPFRRSSSRYSSEAEDGSWNSLPPLPEAGRRGGGRGRGDRRRGASARYPFLRSGEAGATALSRTGSSLLDSSEDEAQVFAVRADTDAGTTEEALGTADPGGRSGADAGTDSDGSSGSSGSSSGNGSSDEEAPGFPVGDDGDLPAVQHVGEKACPAKTAVAPAGAAAAADSAAPETMPPKCKKMESSSESFEEQPFCFSSDSGLFSLAPSGKSKSKSKDGDARRFFQSGGGGGGAGASGSSRGGAAPGMMTGVLSSCVGITPPATPGAAAATLRVATKDNGGGAGAWRALQQAANFDTGRLTDTVGWNGENPPKSNRGGGVSGSREFAAAGGGDFDTGPFFVCGRGGDGSAVQGGGATAGRTTKFDSTGLFESTKRWFDSVSTIAGGGGEGEGESNAQGGGGGGGGGGGSQTTVALESSLFDTE